MANKIWKVKKGYALQIWNQIWYKVQPEIKIIIEISPANKWYWPPLNYRETVELHLYFFKYVFRKSSYYVESSFAFRNFPILIVRRKPFNERHWLQLFRQNKMASKTSKALEFDLPRLLILKVVSSNLASSGIQDGTG